MNLISITDLPLQTQTIILPDGNSFFMEIYFRSMQQGWFINSITYGSNFTLNGLRICNNPNMLYQWRNLLPFGLACFSIANREPSQLQDFSSGASNIYLLTQAEVTAYTAYINGASLE